ncbi:MAG: zf-TFIIB domain-containing protein [Spirulinaceae cyanobacterium SM2_1_0]|nr:zf-TFIIB domain-containing protein [Spirulinaceae cyanobacterium SM2_1_0]
MGSLDRCGKEKQVVDCPKCKNVVLLETRLAGELPAARCSQCGGSWLPALAYQQWQRERPNHNASPEHLLNGSYIHLQPSEFDTKACLCPQCRRYLSRTRVESKPPFFLEHCQECEGFWFDAGEWEALRQLGLANSLPELFDPQWQAQFREQQQIQAERQQMIDKLGPDLAQKIVELTDTILDHKNGDFALAYIMRKAVNNPNIENFKDEKIV